MSEIDRVEQHESSMDNLPDCKPKVRRLPFTGLRYSKNGEIEVDLNISCQGCALYEIVTAEAINPVVVLERFELCPKFKEKFSREGMVIFSDAS